MVLLETRNAQATFLDGHLGVEPRDIRDGDSEDASKGSARTLHVFCTEEKLSGSIVRSWWLICHHRRQKKRRRTRAVAKDWKRMSFSSRSSRSPRLQRRLPAR